ncbi:MAG TPA: flagellin [Candidatus Saccharimonadales bacterium]|nr:flagellin [Candidatus Saccharimonadales bacterium]
MAYSDISRIRSNIQSLNILQALQGVSRDLATHQLRLATGKQINEAGDDPAGLTIATKLDIRSRNLSQITQNLGEAQNLIGVAEGGLEKLKDVLSDMSAKILKAASDSIGTSERQAISAQLVQLTSEINSIASDTSFNGVSLLNSAVTFTFQTGESSQTAFTSANYSATALAMTNMAALTDGSVINSANYATYLQEVTSALGTVTSGLTTVGSLANRFTVKEDVIAVAQTNTQAAYSRIMDADVAQEQMYVVRDQILQQTATSVLAQANVNSQSLLALFR